MLKSGVNFSFNCRNDFVNTSYRRVQTSSKANLI